MPKKVFLGLALIVTILGIGTGFLLAHLPVSSTRSSSTSATGTKQVSTSTEIGSTDTKVYPDTATGTLEAGGIGNEGTHKLIRDGGPSQTVYLISSLVDLGQFVGKKVQIWGATMKAQKASWLMDVGRVKLVE